MEQQFTKYEIARIIGARALQIAMDAPLLLKFSEDELSKIMYDSIKIAEKEFEEEVLPISINRPMPRKKKAKLAAEKEEAVPDADLVAKEQEVEKELVEDAAELGLVPGDEVEDYADEAVPQGSTGAEEQ
jgi:DNA-directed RNA polymerase subunit K